MTEAVRSTSWSDGRGPLAILPDLLFRNDRPFLTIPLAWVLSIGISLLLGLAIATVAPGAEAPDLGGAPPLVIMIGVALVAPLVESVIMGGVMQLLLRWLGAWQAVLVSAAGWGVAHSLSTPTWGLVIWWPFLIFSIIFVTWRPRGFWVAVLMAALVHGLQNLFPAIAIISGLA